MDLKTVVTVVAAAVSIIVSAGNLDLSTILQPYNEDPKVVLNQEAAIFDVVMDDDYYGYADSNITNPPVWTVPSGSDIVFHFENRGQLKHNWAIVKENAMVPVPYNEDLDSEILLYDAGTLLSNTKSTITLSAPASGTYQIICTVAGHYPFMQGRLVVAEVTR